MSEMVERVALAIQEALLVKTSAESSLMGVARAAIEAMRDVPDSITDKIRFTPFPSGRAGYEAVIDAALAEKIDTPSSAPINP